MGTPYTASSVPRIKDLFGEQRLPVPLKPQADELFSSWFTRLAKANAMRPNQLGACLIGRGRQLFSGDPDRGVWKEPGLALAGFTGVSPEQLESTYLSAYAGYLWPSRPRHGVWRHVLHLSDRKRQKDYFGLQYCPQCLASDAVPYFRKHWRLGFSVVCDLHGCKLRDQCPHCHSPVMPNLCDVGQKWLDCAPGITDCYNCEGTLLVPSEVVSKALCEFQDLLLTSLERGWMSLAGRCVHSILFFEGFRMLLSFLDDARKSERLCKSIYIDLPESMLEPSRLSRYGGVETISLASRLRLLAMASVLFKNWPSGAMIFLQKSGVSSRDIFTFNRGPIHTVPFWLWQPIKFAIDHTPYVSTDGELSNAAVYLFMKESGATARDLCRLMNLKTRSNRRVSKAWARVQLSVAENRAPTKSP